MADKQTAPSITHGREIVRLAGLLDDAMDAMEEVAKARRNGGWWPELTGMPALQSVMNTSELPSTIADVVEGWLEDKCRALVSEIEAHCKRISTGVKDQADG